MMDLPAIPSFRLAGRRALAAWHIPAQDTEPEEHDAVMAAEWGGPGIGADTICPTFILNGQTGATFDDPGKRAWIEDRIKLDRPGEVEDIMEAAVHCAPDASALVTGTAVRIGGGWTEG